MPMPIAPKTPRPADLKPPTRKKAAGTKPRTAKTPAMNLAEVRAFITALAGANPAPRTELDYQNPYTLLVAVVLSAQATDVGVNRATKTLFAEAPDPASMVALGVDGVARHIRTIGLWHGKARNVVELSRQLLERHGGQVPHDRDALEALPGVGRKTANVVLNVAFGEPTLAVDTHVFRVSNRIPLAKGKTPREVEDGLMQIIPERFLADAHHWLILFGRYTCKARAPECGTCVIKDLCDFAGKTG